MGRETDLVFEQYIGTEFGATLVQGPLFCSADQRSTHSPAAEGGVDVPPFQISHTVRHTAVDDVSNGQLDQPHRFRVLADSEQDLLGLVSLAGEKTLDRFAVLVQ
jgi:hypothetical protein